MSLSSPYTVGHESIRDMSETQTRPRRQPTGEGLLCSLTHIGAQKDSPSSFRGVVSTPMSLSSPYTVGHESIRDMSETQTRPRRQPTGEGLLCSLTYIGAQSSVSFQWRRRQFSVLCRSNGFVYGQSRLQNDDEQSAGMRKTEVGVASGNSDNRWRMSGVSVPLAGVIYNCSIIFR